MSEHNTSKKGKSSHMSCNKSKIYDILTYEQFQLEILARLKNQIDYSYNIELVNVLKNNSVELVALVIQDHESVISPNIYLESYYQHYLDGMRIRNITEMIIDSHFEYLEEANKNIPDFEFKWEAIKDKVFLRLVNREKNKKLLEEVPHLLYLDLAITFHYLVSSRADGINILRITKKHMKKWNIKIKELRDTAIENTPRLFPANIRNMNDVLVEMLYDDWANTNQDWPGQNTESNMWISDNLLPDDMLLELVVDRESDDNPMYILSNDMGINGASCILYQDILYEFAHEIESDLYILPGSIHEVIIVKDNGYISKEDLVDMVVGVNETEVFEEDYLSNNVYHYNRYTNMLSL